MTSSSTFSSSPRSRSPRSTTTTRPRGPPRSSPSRARPDRHCRRARRRGGAGVSEQSIPEPNVIDAEPARPTEDPLVDTTKIPQTRGRSYRSRFAAVYIVLAVVAGGSDRRGHRPDLAPRRGADARRGRRGSPDGSTDASIKQIADQVSRAVPARERRPARGRPRERPEGHGRRRRDRERRPADQRHRRPARYLARSRRGGRLRGHARADERPVHPVRSRRQLLDPGRHAVRGAARAAAPPGTRALALHAQVPRRHRLRHRLPPAAPRSAGRSHLGVPEALRREGRALEAAPHDARTPSLRRSATCRRPSWRT